MSLGRQFPGTAKHPQGRLFKPEYTGDPHKLSPENWMSQDASVPFERKVDRGAYGGTSGDQPTANRNAGDILTYHTNMTGELPAKDDPFRPELGMSVTGTDAKGRPFGPDGSPVGMHFGTVKAGWDRIAHENDPQPAVAHAVKLPASKQFGRGDTPFNWDPKGRHVDPSGPVTPWDDDTANHNSSLTDMVEEGYAIPYRNNVEDEGSISYRVDRSQVRTWGEDVKAAPKSGKGAPHPAYQYLAEKGYNPVIETGKIHEAIEYQPRQLPLTVTSHDVPGKNVMGEPLRLGGPINPLRGDDVDKFSQKNIDVYNEETTRIQNEAKGMGPQFSQWTMKKNV